MSAVSKLAAFAAGLALVGGGAIALGSATEPDPPGGKSADEQPAARGDGTRPSAGGLTLGPAGTTLASGRRQTWRFRVVDGNGRTVRDLEPEGSKLMHLIVVRSDSSGFQHLHPRRERDGSFAVELELDRPGRYRAIADFSRGGERHFLGTDLRVPGRAERAALPPVSTTAASNGYEVWLSRPAELTAGREAELTFNVTRDGEPVHDLQPYLGASGHLVALRYPGLAYSHVHPLGRASEGRIRFAVELDGAGPHRLFLQFRVDGRVETVSFTQDVAAGDVEPPAAGGH